MFIFTFLLFFFVFFVCISDIFRQLTLMELDLFRSISGRDLYYKTVKKQSEKAPKLMELIARFNSVSVNIYIYEVHSHLFFNVRLSSSLEPFFNSLFSLISFLCPLGLFLISSLLPFCLPIFVFFYAFIFSFSFLFFSFLFSSLLFFSLLFFFFFFFFFVLFCFVLFMLLFYLCYCFVYVIVLFCFVVL